MLRDEISVWYLQILFPIESILYVNWETFSNIFVAKFELREVSILEISFLKHLKIKHSYSQNQYYIYDRIQISLYC